MTGLASRSPLWPRADLVRRLCSVLQVAGNAIDVIAANGFSDTEVPANSVRPEKVISETGLLLLAASTANHHREVRERVADVAQKLEPHARSERMLLAICTEPALAWDYAFAHVCLKRLGYADGRFDSVLRLIRRSQAQYGRERSPHRALEQWWTKRGFDSNSRSSRTTTWKVPTFVSDSVLCHPMDVLNGRREDIYAFTHSLMYVTDLNITPAPLPRLRAAILADASAVLARCLDEQDYDLAGEVLLAWPLTGRTWEPAAAFGFRVLAHVEDQAGFLPSTSTKLDRLSGLKGEGREQYLLATAYHTIYVMGLLCAAALQTGRLPPASIEGRRANPRFADLVLTELDADTRRPHWRDELARLSERERGSLSAVLLAIGLHRTVAARDFGRTHKLLHIAEAAGLTDTPSASQAAELLQRLATINCSCEASVPTRPSTHGANGH